VQLTGPRRLLILSALRVVNSSVTCGIRGVSVLKRRVLFVPGCAGKPALLVELVAVCASNVTFWVACTAIPTLGRQWPFPALPCPPALAASLAGPNFGRWPSGCRNDAVSARKPTRDTRAITGRKPLHSRSSLIWPVNILCHQARHRRHQLGSWTRANLDWTGVRLLPFLGNR
jgi:hypothetical protein